MRAETYGNPKGPILICSHGLMGGPDDFSLFQEEWAQHYQLLLLDMSAAARDKGLRHVEQGNELLCYDSMGEEIVGYLSENFPGQRVFFTGVSLGGKILFDIIKRKSDLIKAAVITDVSPGPLTGTSLFSFIEHVIPSINLNQPWPDLKKTLEECIPDRKMRVLMQTQIDYPNSNTSAVWKPAMKGLRNSLIETRMKNQWEGWVDGKCRVVVLRATGLSAISDADLKRMQKTLSFELVEVTGANHFIHVSHADLYRQTVLSLLSE